MKAAEFIGQLAGSGPFQIVVDGVHTARAGGQDITRAVARTNQRRSGSYRDLAKRSKVSEVGNGNAVLTGSGYQRIAIETGSLATPTTAEKCAGSGC